MTEEQRRILAQARALVARRDDEVIISEPVFTPPPVVETPVRDWRDRAPPRSRGRRQLLDTEMVSKGAFDAVVADIDRRIAAAVEAAVAREREFLAHVIARVQKTADEAVAAEREKAEAAAAALVETLRAELAKQIKFARTEARLDQRERSADLADDMRALGAEFAELKTTVGEWTDLERARLARLGVDPLSRLKAVN